MSQTQSDERRDAIPAPLEFTGMRVLPEWIDYNGHMNVAYYLLAFDKAIDWLWEFMGVGPDYVKTTNRSTFTLECHMNFLREIREGEPMRFTFELIDHDRKKWHCFGRMFHADQGYLSATMEWMTLHVDLTQRRGVEVDDAIHARLVAMKAAHATLPRAPEVGRAIGMKKPAAT